MIIRAALSVSIALVGFCTAPLARAAFVSPNTGSLGAAANGSNADSVIIGLGVVTAGADKAAYYNNVTGTNTVVPFQLGLNPASASPFTVEFWANPAGTDNDDSPVSNRDAVSANRSGWAFFQRAAGWNLRMYNGVGSGLGWDLTGGTSTLNSWSHVVATWNGTSAVLYVNGVLADNTNDPAATGVYNANTSTNINFLIAATDTASPFNGAVDEVAFYGTALSAGQILNHFNAVSSATPGAYYSLIQSDGARLQLSNVPEPSAIAMLGIASVALGARRSRKR
jgi:hypothetical protein